MYETPTENYPAEYDVIEVDGQRVTSPSVLSVFGSAEQKEALVSPQPVLGITGDELDAQLVGEGALSDAVVALITQGEDGE